VLFAQFDWLLSSGYSCTIHLRKKQNDFPFRSSLYRRAILSLLNAERETKQKLQTLFKTYSLKLVLMHSRIYLLKSGK
jgi:hypothetical protein